jgi:lipopolysaccharide/colanic/teichoic acid biosynthesis glycosyltransferase
MNGSANESCVPQSKIKTPWETALLWLSVASRSLALIVLIIYMPALLAAALLVVFTSPGPPFVRKAYKRSREIGQIVYLYEFRTECWHTWNETPVGKLLRQADLHRIPRLANVLLGEVGVGERVEAVRA